MKRLAYALVVMMLASVVSFAQNTGTAEQRAQNLSDKMIRELQLNNYQSRKIRQINLEKARKMVEFEAKHANDKAELEKCINGVCKERDVELANLLSTAQYSQYYSSRKSFNSFDREYAVKLQKQNSKVAKTLVAQDKEDAKRSFPAAEVAVIKEASPSKN
ncbi:MULTISPECIES: hypothetical protein [Rufibacter]|uniref:DUF4168 domain-containing protein n=1 Tax=Rufibacter quisquiliarum TaxID=1549639 RepID=A0A839GSP3_9BACT|nr:MULTISPECIES: hypothetical protein [Rufibacter]MBA9077887.1 hypothetical protein [Rufibacter quisquiliarum]